MHDSAIYVRMFGWCLLSQETASKRAIYARTAVTLALQASIQFGNLTGDGELHTLLDWAEDTRQRDKELQNELIQVGIADCRYHAQRGSDWF